jgi:ABC-type sugar transport system substrate-binding protein
MYFRPSLRPHPLKLGLTAALAAVALFAAACGSTSGTSSSSTTTSNDATTSAPSSGSTPSATGSGNSAITAAESNLAQFSNEVTTYAALKPISGVSRLKGKTVWYIPIGSAVPILSGFGVGMGDALAALGMKEHVCDGMFLPTTISSCLTQAASQGADGVVTGYIDYKLVPTAFENLVAHHIPVLVAGEANDSGKAISPSFAFDDTSPTINLLQKLDDEQVIVDSKGKAKILFIGVTDSPQTLGAAAYSKTFFQQNCPACTFTEIFYNTAEIQRVPSQVSAALIANPSTNWVVVELDAAGAGAYNGILTAGYRNKVSEASTNGGLDSLQRIKAGEVQVVDVGTSPIALGWQFTDGIIRMMLGQLPVNGLGDVRVFTKANVGGLTLTPTAYDTNDWYGTSSFEQPYLKAWGIS